MPDRNITKFKIFNNDILFTLCNLQFFKELGNKKLIDRSIFIISAPETITNEAKKKELIQLYHSHPILGGHAGSKRLCNKLKQKFYWKNMSRDVAQFIKNCHKCQTNKAKANKKIPLQITDTPQSAFDKVSIDTIGPLQRTERGHIYAVTLMCNLTKYLIIVPINNKEARTVAKAIMENLFLKFGFCKAILTDRGTEYINSIFEEIAKILKIKHEYSTPYHPETLGGIERSHRTLNEYLRHYINPELNNWDDFLPYFTFCYNTTPHSSFELKFSPFELVYGKIPFIPNIMTTGKIDPVYNIDDYSREIKFKLQSMANLARELLIKSKHTNKTFYDKKTKIKNFSINDKVLAVNHTNNKLEKIYDGPFIITKIDNTNVEIKDEKTNKTKLTHINNILKYFA